MTNRDSMILKDAVDVLSKTVNKTALHALDESNIKGLLRALYQAGVILDVDEAYTLAIDHGWSEKTARWLRGYVGKISAGGRVQVKHSPDWGKTTADKILSRH